MKAAHPVNFPGGHFMFPKGPAARVGKPNGEKEGYGASLNNQRKGEQPHEGVKSSRYEYLDASHLEMLDLNKNIQHILPKPVKPSLNLESVCKETSAILRHSRRAKGAELHPLSQYQQHQPYQPYQQHQQQQPWQPHHSQQPGAEHKNVKHLYELGLPQIIGTYIQPLSKNNDGEKDPLGNNPFPLGSTSPFFQLPKFSPKQMQQPTNKFLPLQLNSERKNLYGLPSYLIPEDKPKSLTVTVVPNKDKDLLEREAKQMKLLLDSSSQGIVNSTPDYQKIISSSMLSNSDDGNTSGGSRFNCGDNASLRNGHNDMESDFSFGRNEDVRDEFAGEQEAENNNYDCFFNELYDANNFTPYGEANEGGVSDTRGDQEGGHQEGGHQEGGHQEGGHHEGGHQEGGHHEGGDREHGYHLPLSEKHLHRGTRKAVYKGRSVNINSALERKEENGPGGHRQSEQGEDNHNSPEGVEGVKRQVKKASPSPSKRTLLAKKKEQSDTPLKNLEPSTCFRNPKTYVNIRLGKPKKCYVTNSSDPIDKKLKDWHNTHNSQVGWKKSRRGVYTFGGTEVVLSLVHDKIIVKKINGKYVKDNLLSVEKFVSLNELFELHREQTDNLLKRRAAQTFLF
ncbi:hypothetical protein, conserved [Plasmodium vivax]|uniref:Uncharacterized protein n=1 Tax=Plasmodium vivax (strain Salvador I) TaxID=126793 RepID=A5KCG8_PLAVS|nr:hypothetical protein, conserved [Plasmodium vivax]EDL42909.1 hypothetical protein, conserved [Plasmodium vivax]|eukprot:XP_001608571.1 hypothetical protein [Plasmodium vivax Sal-1]